MGPMGPMDFGKSKSKIQMEPSAALRCAVRCRKQEGCAWGAGSLLLGPSCALPSWMRSWWLHEKMVQKHTSSSRAGGRAVRTTGRRG